MIVSFRFPLVFFNFFLVFFNFVEGPDLLSFDLEIVLLSMMVSLVVNFIFLEETDDRLESSELSLSRFHNAGDVRGDLAVILDWSSESTFVWLSVFFPL